MFSRRAEQQWPHHCNWNIFHSQPGDMQTQLLSLSRMRESPTGFILLAECGLWEQARGLEKTSSEIRSSFKMSLWIRETIKSRQRVMERSGYWDALLPFPVQLRPEKQPRWWSYSWKTHDTEYRAARVKNFPARTNPHKKQKILWNCSLQEFYGIATCSCLRKLI